MLITYINKIGIWKPICNSKNYKCLSYIFSKKKPSVNRIRCIHKKYLQESSVESIIYKFKNIASEKYFLWSVVNSNYFIADRKDNDQKGELLYSINNDYVFPEKLARIEKTKKYKKIIGHTNFNIWRPICSENFKSAGDIVLNSKINPNNK